jgi:integrase
MGSELLIDSGECRLGFGLSHARLRDGCHHCTSIGRSSRRVFSARMSAGSAPASVRLIHSVLHGALADAVRQRLVPRNVAEFARPPRLQHQEMIVLSPDEARALLTAAAEANDRMEPLWTVALATGMRQGELLALRWRDINLEVASLSVQHTLIYHNTNNWRLAPPKTRASRRHIVLSNKAVTALRQQRTRQLEERLAAGPLWSEHDLVFTNEGGSPLANQRIGRLLNKALERAGLAHIRFHDLRHTAATEMLRAGVDSRVVATVLGHRSMNMMRRYAHVAPELVVEAAKKAQR